MDFLIITVDFMSNPKNIIWYLLIMMPLLYIGISFYIALMIDLIKNPQK